MKHSICGFNHTALCVTFKLDYIDAQILKAIIDFRDSGKMKKIIHDGKDFLWIYHGWLLDELPFIGISTPKVLGRRMGRYVENGLMEKCVEKGNRTYYRFVEDSINTLQSFPQFKGLTPVLQSSPFENPGTLKSLDPVLQSPTIDPSTINPLKENISSVFSHWKSKKNLISHRELTPVMEKQICRVLKEMTVEEIKKIIDNYTVIVSSTEYRYTYKHPLEEFFRKGSIEKAPPYRKFSDEYEPFHNFRINKADAEPPSHDHTPRQPVASRSLPELQAMVTAAMGRETDFEYPDTNDVNRWNILFVILYQTTNATSPELKEDSKNKCREWSNE